MYCPTHFKEERPEVLHQLMAQQPMATIVSTSPDGLAADHAPLYYQAQTGTHGKLIGHVARANPLWQNAAGQEVLVVFQGPSHYISPQWYATKATGGKVVPTWNYAVVHAHATLTPLEAPEAILPIITHLTQRFEAEYPAKPWQVSDAPTDFTEQLLRHIVGIELHITRIQGKWKVSQNQPAANRDSVAVSLDALPSAEASRMAALVRGQFV